MTQQDVFNKFDTFLSDNNNQYVERVDPSSLYQCFDLAVYWCEYLGLPKEIFAGLYYAKDIWVPSTNLAVQNFDYIDNSPDAVPMKGDMIVWNGGYNGGAGHVGIATGNATLWYFECFEQNDPQSAPSHLRNYNYDYVLGWLRFKTSQPVPPPMTDTQKVNAITKEVQSGNSDGDKVTHIKNILGL